MRFQSITTAFLVLVTMFLQPAWTADDDIPGYGWKQNQSYSYTQGDVQLITDILFRGELSIYGSLSGKDFEEIKQLKVGRLNLQEGADSGILSKEGLFPDVSFVCLSDRANLTALRLLYENQRQITSLVIEQEEVLGDEAIELLACFKSLTYLQLSCPLESPELLIGCLPDSIEFVNLFGTGVGSIASQHPRRLSRLKRISLNEPISSVFMNGLQAPRLEELNLHGKMEKGCIKNVFRFHNLHYLTFNREAPPIDDLYRLANGSPPGGLVVSYHGENKEVSKIIGKVIEKASKKPSLLRLKGQILLNMQEMANFYLKPRLDCTIVNRSPDGYDIRCGASKGVLITRKKYVPGESLRAYVIDRCSGRVLLTDSLSED